MEVSAIALTSRQPDLTRVLILEPDPTTAQRMVGALGGHVCDAQPHDRREDDREQETCCVVLGSLDDLYGFDLGRADVVICAAQLPDGPGLRALDYLRARSPLTPVVMMGAADDAEIALEAIQAGAMDFLTNAGHDLPSLPLVVDKCLAQQQMRVENQRLQDDLSCSLTELAVRNRQLQALVRQLETVARTDDLTGLANRRALNEALERFWGQVARESRPLAFLMIDVDDFKSVNDVLGHQRGDEVLHRVGRIIEANCRQLDLAARYGGDEYCVVMPECDGAEAVRAAHRILQAFEQADGDDEPRLGLSIGVAHVALSAPATIDQLIRHADEAMYAAKAAGKGRVMVRRRDGIAPPGPLEAPAAPPARYARAV